MNRAHPGVLLLVLHEVIVQDGDEHVDGGEHDEEEVGGHVEEGQAVVAALHRLVAHDREVAAREVPRGAMAQQLSGHNSGQLTTTVENNPPLWRVRVLSGHGAGHA